MSKEKQVGKKEVQFESPDYHFMHYCHQEKKVAEDGSIYLEAEITPDFLNPYGLIHGGYLASMADNVGGFNALRCMEKPLTLNSRMDFYRNCSSGKLIATADVVKKGHKICVIRVDINCEGRLLAQATITYFNSAQ